ncbi:hypothetical protein FHS40_006144 [Streptomyces spectabilis]|uniref:Uncharacterized protein n=1 Tax=Streptomyces spectabilis TaxID=68270 RepID=A0A7W8AYR7_STRST|nr:hypothetical protein [Streptomyces spectabilis]
MVLLLLTLLFVLLLALLPRGTGPGAPRTRPHWYRW